MSPLKSVSRPVGVVAAVWLLPLFVLTRVFNLLTPATLRVRSCGGYRAYVARTQDGDVAAAAGLWLNLLILIALVAYAYCNY